MPEAVILYVLGNGTVAQSRRDKVHGRFLDRFVVAIDYARWMAILV